MNDPSLWISTAAAVAAWIAVWFAYVSARTAARAFQLSNSQEERRRPQLVPYLADGYVRRRDRETGRVYAISLSVSNPTDSDNAVARVELQVRYTTQQHVQLTLKLPHDESLRAELNRPDLSTLTPPVRVNAHGTVAGWVFFGLTQAIIGDGVIEGYKVLLTDSHGAVSQVAPIIMRELADAPSLDGDHIQNET